MQGSALAWSLLHEQPSERGKRITRLESSWHGSVLLLFDHFLEAREGSRRHGRPGAAAVPFRHVGVVPHADDLAAGHHVRDAAEAPTRHLRPQQVQVCQADQGKGGQTQALQEAPLRKEAPAKTPRRQQERQGSPHRVHVRALQVLDVLDVLDILDVLSVLHTHRNHVLHNIDARIERKSTVAGRLGLPALSADARLEGVDAVAAGVVAAGPLAGAALSLVLEAVLEAVLRLRIPRRLGLGLPES